MDAIEIKITEIDIEMTACFILLNRNSLIEPTQTAMAKTSLYTQFELKKAAINIAVDTTKLITSHRRIALKISFFNFLTRKNISSTHIKVNMYATTIPR